jgi:superfamily II DNA or RNA helicase
VVTEALVARRTPGVTLPLIESTAALAGLPADALARLPASVAAWSLAAKLSLDLVARERVMPRVRQGHRGGEARWGVSLSLADDAQRFARLARAFPPSAHALPVDDHEAPPPEPRRRRRRRPRARVWAPPALLIEFLDAVAEALVRRTAIGSAPPPAERQWERRFATALLAPGADPTFAGEGPLDRALLDELAEWLAPSRGTPAGQTARLCLKLDPPTETAKSWRLAYFLQAAEDPSLLVPAAQVWASSGERVEWMDRTFVAPQDLLLRDLARAGRIFGPIESSLDHPGPSEARFDDSAAWRFLVEAAPMLGESGVSVLLPAELSPAGRRRLRLRMRVGGSRRGTAGVVDGGRLSLSAMVGYRWEAAIGESALSTEEFQTLVSMKRPLIRWRGQWLVLDREEIAAVSRFLAEGGGRLTGREALVAALVETMPRDGARPPVHVLAEGPLAAALERLRTGGDPVPPPADLVGSLRPYQERGLAWLHAMAAIGLGGCLADDMGLGKTVQTIAFLLSRRAASPADRRPTLIVCPTSVLGNWERELARFAPTLPVLRHHGWGRAREARALAEAEPHAVVITTYGLLRRDVDVLGAIEWGVVVLDEAQNIKNPAARQAVAARSLRAEHRFALTGTPVENRLAELWSILEFCAPGLLGPLERFRRQFAIPIERYRDDHAAEHLRRLVRPFVLRRLKSDPAVAADLPAKQEMAVVCTLTREQATLYQAAVEESMERIEHTTGIERRGLVLALLTSLKQICNHPAHYLRERGPLAGRSGKLERTCAMLEETIAAGDRTLVFTQYREMGDRLVAHLRATLGVEPLFLHGGVPRLARDAMVRRFQEDPDAPPVFVLSLKAGGTGLNLTRATRVIHYDRWWNPAVEDQATDRTHRIGQHRVVQVYRLLAAGTLEERIDAMLVDKRALADRIVGPGETWITEMSDKELRQLLALSSDAAVADE